MTGLLVSVRNESEALAALEAGADLIDVKEPSRGSLGAVDAEVARQIACCLGNRVPLSIALGELRDWEPSSVEDNRSGSCFQRPPGGVSRKSDSVETNRPAESSTESKSHPAQCEKNNDLLHGFSYAKIGMAGCADLPGWTNRWELALASIPTLSHVAVAYADWHFAKAPSPEQIVCLGAQLGCRVFLLDTYVKSGGNLLDYMNISQLERLIEDARTNRMRVVLAGSLRDHSIRQVLPLRPDLVAVRGAACRQSRNGTVDGLLVRRLIDLVRCESRNSARVG